MGTRWPETCWATYKGEINIILKVTSSWSLYPHWLENLYILLQALRVVLMQWALHIKVYWNWIKRDQLDVTCFIISLFNAQHVSVVNISILRSLWLTCSVISWVVLLWFDVCWCYVVVWLWCCGIRMQAEELVPEDGCINIRNMLNIKKRNNKTSDIKLVSFQLSRLCTVQ